ncbi:HEXXH motif domain-containing protein [Streptomyces sp. NPDC005574]|uniref:HEXXH motif domain-containing protein n=1 Tax=Streptomyces sp. NPDC005574 TaxID=3156891 RepID=UPI00339E4E63
MQHTAHPRPHVLAPRSFEELLGGGGGPATVAALRASERSWRLLVVRALLDAAGTAPAGPLPRLADGWRLLTRAHAASPGAVEALLAYPAVGVWAAHTLRRLRGSAGDDATPLWADTGYLHAIAAAAAFRAGLDFRTGVPVRDGWAVLPALGAMRVPATGDLGATRVPGTGDLGVTEVSAAGGCLRIAGRAAGGTGWHPLTALRAEGCTLLLDDTDPYRALRTPAAPDPLDRAADWQELFREAWRILSATDAETAGALSDGLVSVVPRPRGERFRPHSASSGDAFGTALASLPDDAEQFASTLVHEFQHNKLSAFMHLFTLYDDQGTGLLYAPWRDDPRPLGGLLQGVYAFFGVTAFWRRRRHPLGQFEFALWRSQTAHALRAVGRAEQLTDLGRRLVGELSGRLEPWLAEPVDAPVLTAAELAVADHRALWRAYHLAAAGPTGEPRLTPRTPARGFDTRAVLLRWLLADPAGFERLRDDPGATVSGARPEDAALVSGRTAEAMAAFRARVVRGDGDPETWVGLGLAARAEGDPAGEGLLARPERAMARYADSAGAADPLEIGRELGRCPTGAGADPLRAVASRG